MMKRYYLSFFLYFGFDGVDGIGRFDIVQSDGTSGQCLDEDLLDVCVCSVDR